MTNPVKCDLANGAIVQTESMETGNHRKNYRILRKIGEGGFGIVYLAESEGNQYAVKILKMWEMKKGDQENYNKRFNRAYEVMHTQSTHLIHSVGRGFVSGNPFYVMEFCPKGDLLTHFQSIPKTSKEHEVIRCMYQSLLGLRDLHNRGMVHRDIKPENVMMRSDGTVALNDFDLAGDENNRYTTQYIFGVPKQSFYTKAFAPPEQVNPIRGKKEVMVMPTIDIFAFGVMTYQLLTGRFPFGKTHSESDMAVYYARVNNNNWDKDALLQLKYADFWVRFLAPCLKGNYAERLSNVQELIDQLEKNFPHILVNTEEIDKKSNVLSGNLAIKIVYGDDMGRVFSLPKDKLLLTLGRDTIDTHNDLPLRDDNNHFISRKHATIEWDVRDNHWYIRDGQFDLTSRTWKPSKNGTYVNSREIDSRNGAQLRAGDVIYVGESRLKVFDESEM